MLFLDILFLYFQLDIVAFCCWWDVYWMCAGSVLTVDK